MKTYTKTNKYVILKKKLKIWFKSFWCWYTKQIYIFTTETKTFLFQIVVVKVREQKKSQKKNTKENFYKFSPAIGLNKATKITKKKSIYGS